MPPSPRPPKQPPPVLQPLPLRPLPAFYCVYLLRSTIRHSSLYVGSTPDPIRRLKQHNGVSKGGAKRTSRDSLRPWEMGCVVHGFPSHIGALQFEWALQNPHLTLHIPPSSRLTLPAGRKKKSGRPKRPQHSLSSLLANLHLLLHVPSFSRWPLKLRFFARDVHAAWVRYTTKTAGKEVRGSLEVMLDFPARDGAGTVRDALPAAIEALGDGDATTPAVPSASQAQLRNAAILPPNNLTLLNLSVDWDREYTKVHVAKAKEIFDFEMEGPCSVCGDALVHGRGIHVCCPRGSCKAISHIACLSSHFLAQEREQTAGNQSHLEGEDEDEAVLPVKGTCKLCGGESEWTDIIAEATLRLRGKNEIEKLFRVRKVKKSQEQRDDEKEAKRMAKLAARQAAKEKLTMEGESDAESSATAPKKRGRPRGSPNKNKEIKRTKVLLSTVNGLAAVAAAASQHDEKEEEEDDSNSLSEMSDGSAIFHDMEEDESDAMDSISEAAEADEIASQMLEAAKTYEEATTVSTIKDSRFVIPEGIHTSSSACTISPTLRITRAAASGPGGRRSLPIEIVDSDLEEDDL